MKRIAFWWIIIILIFTLASCGGIQNWWTKLGANVKTGNYTVSVYSYGKEPLKVWHIKNGYVNTESNSDGWYFDYNGKLIRISGTVVVEEE